MNCEQVEELLSAYLDDALAVGEAAESAAQLKLEIAAHLVLCARCSAILADYRRLDNLLAQLPRVTPDPSLRHRIFSSPEYLELTGTDNVFDDRVAIEQTVPQKRVPRSSADGSRPRLVALPGGRQTSSAIPTRPRLPASRHDNQETAALPLQRRHAWGLRVMQIAVAALILLTLGAGSIIGWNVWVQHSNTAQVSNAITPPAGLPQGLPLSAGMHFVFLRDGALWSAPAGGSTPPQQLTPGGVSVAAGWVVSPPLTGRYAGDMLAYIDLQKALVHTLRSDGLRDTIVQQPLLKAGISPSSVWDTATGAAILDSLAWSPDSSMLAFVADPEGTGLTNLYIYSLETGVVQKVPLPMQGSVSHPIWSPDGIRVAFEVSHNGTQSIVDYNTQNHGLLVISKNVQAEGMPNDTLLTLDWSPDANTPTITWSVGVIGHVHSIWQQHVGSGWTPTPQEMVAGDYVQAIYSRNGHDGIGSWLLVTSVAGRAADLWRLDMTPGAAPVALTSGKEVDVAQWSPDGTKIDYLDALSSGTGTLHVVDASTAQDMLIAAGVADDPAPAWSVDAKQLVYSTGTQTAVVTPGNSQKIAVLKLRGHASTFTWFASSPHQLIVTLSDGQQGAYLIDTGHMTIRQLYQEDISGPILWTQVP